MAGVLLKSNNFFSRTIDSIFRSIENVKSPKNNYEYKEEGIKMSMRDEQEERELIEFREASIKDYENGRFVSFTDNDEMNKWLKSL